MHIRRPNFIYPCVICSIEEGIPMAVLLSFASEGNNDGDGMNLANYANQWIQMVYLDFFISRKYKFVNNFRNMYIRMILFLG